MRKQAEGTPGVCRSFEFEVGGRVEKGVLKIVELGNLKFLNFQAWSRKIVLRRS